MKCGLEKVLIAATTKKANKIGLNEKASHFFLRI